MLSEKIKVLEEKLKNTAFVYKEDREAIQSAIEVMKKVEFNSIYQLLVRFFPSEGNKFLTQDEFEKYAHSLVEWLKKDKG